MANTTYPSAATKQPEMKVSWVYEANRKSKTRYTVNEGGTRSTKTYSILQNLVTYLNENRHKPEIYSVVRKTMPALRATAMRDFFDILKSLNMYHEENHNKTENIYRVGKAEIEFFGLDESRKVRGRKRKILYVNEANELTPEDFFQLDIRTTDKCYLDYNPSEIDHWIYREDAGAMMPAAKRTNIKSTFRDNPFLERSLVERIEAIEGQNANLWKIYGLGERAVLEETIFKEWDLCNESPANVDETVYGLDFGFVTSPAALLEIGMKDNQLYLDELLYEQRLTNTQLCEKMDELIRVRDAYIIADSAEPKSIEEIAQYQRKDGSHFNIIPCVKGADSVFHSIQTVWKYKLHVTQQSTNLQAELKKYMWKKDKNGEVFKDSNGRPSPVKLFDHLISCLRYGVDTYELEFGTSGAQVLFDV